MNNNTNICQSVVAFFLNDVRCGVFSESIQEITALPQLTPVPGGCGSLRGLFAYKGSIVPVFSFSGICTADKSLDEPICLILCNGNGELFAITVSQVDKFLSDDFDLLSEKCECIKYGGAVMRSVPIDSGIILLMDIDKTFASLFSEDEK